MDHFVREVALQAEKIQAEHRGMLQKQQYGNKEHRYGNKKEIHVVKRSKHTLVPTVGTSHRQRDKMHNNLWDKSEIGTPLKLHFVLILSVKQSARGTTSVIATFHTKKPKLHYWKSIANTKDRGSIPGDMKMGELLESYSLQRIIIHRY